jgi:hypothetical protein
VLRENESSRISGQSAHEGGKVVKPTRRPLLPPRRYHKYSFLLDAEFAVMSTPVCGYGMILRFYLPFYIHTHTHAHTRVVTDTITRWQQLTVVREVFKRDSMIDTEGTDCTERTEEIGGKFTVFAGRYRLLMAKLCDSSTVSLDYSTRWRVHQLLTSLVAFFV